MLSKSTHLPASAAFRPACSIRHRLLASAATVLALGATAAPTWAADGDGGAGVGVHTSGGTASILGTGGLGQGSGYANTSGGGGGAGVFGGNGGDGNPLGAGGKHGRGGYVPGMHAFDGGTSVADGGGNGGGGGGTHAYVGNLGGLVELSNNGLAMGGQGGVGGYRNAEGNNIGGGGGGGGFGAIVTGLNGDSGTITAEILGGWGGDAGELKTSGGGGNGGTGLLIYQPKGDNVITIAGNTQIQGGSGGWGNTKMGDGARGIVLQDGTGNNTINIAGAVSGGNGGENPLTNSAPGNGGNGVAVVNMVGTTTLNISGSVAGGTSSPVPGGTGGVGIIGADLAIQLTGTASVAGGGNGTGGGQAAAIAFTGGTNMLTLNATSAGAPTISGAITHAGTTDALALGGTGAGTIDSSVIQGFQSFVKSGTSTWAITGGPIDNIDTWVVNGGALSISGNLSSNNAAITLTDATLEATADVVLDETMQLSGASGISVASGAYVVAPALMTGTGTFTKQGDGALFMSGNSSGYTGDVIIQAGVLGLDGLDPLSNVSSWTLSGGSFDISQNDVPVTAQNFSGSSAQSDVNIGSNALTLAQPADASYAGTFTGTGTLTKTGAGTLVLTADSLFSGTTIIDGGILQFGNDGTTGSVAGDIVNNATLSFNRSDDFTLNNAISGTGNLLLEGSGSATFGTAYSGSITALAGGIRLSGDTLANASAVLGSGALLSGTGSIGSLTVLGSGIVGPGNSPGTITVNGPLNFSSGSIYQVDATPTGQSDLITASGTVILSSGSTVQVVAAQGSYAANTTYTILTSDNDISGAFSSVSSNYAFLTPSLSYDPKTVFLTLTYTGTDFASLAQTANHAATANAVQGLGFGNEVFDTMLLLSTDAVPGAFDALSGEAYASANTVIQQQSIYLRSAVDDRLRQGLTGQGSGIAAPATAPGNDLSPMFWMQAYGGSGDTSSDGNAARIDNSIGGLLLGADLALDANVRAGMFGGFSQSSFDADDVNSSGSIDSYNLGLYAGGQFGALGVRGGAAYAWNDVSMSRTVAYPGLTQDNASSYNANTTQVFGELGYLMDGGAFQFEPLAGLAYMHVNGADFTETGGASALSGSTDSMDTFYSTLGLRVSSAIQVGGRDLTSHATIGWQHAFGDITPETSVAFAGGSSPFTVAGAPIAENTLPLQAGITFALSDTAQIDASYLGQFAEDAMQNAFTLQFSMKF